MHFNHKPVLLHEAIHGLNLKPNGTYVDATLGGGGHAEAILAGLKDGRLIGIDRDSDACAAAARLSNAHQNFTPICDNFFNMPKILARQNIHGTDGILMDLGVSSHQLDTPERGFSVRLDGPLDMRMDTKTTLTAADIVNTYPEHEISRILRTFGEEKKHRRIARSICEKRKEKRICTTGELSAIICDTIGHARGMHPATRAFMALRIYINGELDGLEQAITDAAGLLNVGGRLAIITFHSLEDRIVKHTFRRLAATCTCPPKIPVCICNTTPLIKIITPRPITPTESEIQANPRSSSAKLRIAEKIDVKSPWS